MTPSFTLDLLLFHRNQSGLLRYFAITSNRTANSPTITIRGKIVLTTDVLGESDEHSATLPKAKRQQYWNEVNRVVND